MKISFLYVLFLLAFLVSCGNDKKEVDALHFNSNPYSQLTHAGYITQNEIIEVDGVKYQMSPETGPNVKFALQQQSMSVRPEFRSNGPVYRAKITGYLYIPQFGAIPNQNQYKQLTVTQIQLY